VLGPHSFDNKLPPFYAIGTDPTGSSYAFNMTSASNGKLSGDIFVPNGTAYLAFTGTPTLTTFIEADYINGSFTGTPSGDGPQINGGSGGSIIPGDDSLIG